MTLQKFARQGIGVLALGTFLATLPVAVGFQAGQGIELSLAKAFAKDGGDDGGDDGGGSGKGGGGNSGSGSHGGSSNSGSGGGDDHGGRSGGDDDGGGSGRGGGDDASGGGRGGDDNGGRGGSGRGGGDDAPGDDHGGGRGGDDVSRGGVAAPASGGGVRVVKFERTASGVEAVYSNGIKEEIENGRFESRNAAGRTVVERPATQGDVARLSRNARNSGIVPVPAASRAARVEVGGGAIEVTYDTGWREELAGGRYELKDPNDNTVVERKATAADVQRLRALAGS